MILLNNEKLQLKSLSLKKSNTKKIEEGATERVKNPINLSANFSKNLSKKFPINKILVILLLISLYKSKYLKYFIIYL
ncbi:hypothetical protein B0174_00580 [Arcobacter caeni]|uniref:Uncharacterized protein n=1 Tax=Arcobacter caeni TaxID=1912877 RepID=A0A363D5J7_9BACT|nr:hypothetical protein B0174_00580 [Arcobacter caeni]